MVLITKCSWLFSNNLKKILVTLGLASVGLILLGSIPVLYGAGPPGLRMVYLNGVDISTARGQQLKKVDVQISENGDIYIVAPHYQVHEEDSYVPLSQYTQGVNAPSHLAPASSQALTPVTAQNLGASSPPLTPKPGEPLSPPAASQTNKGAMATPSKTKEEDLEAPSADSESGDEAPPKPAAPASTPASTPAPAPASAAASPKE